MALSYQKKLILSKYYMKTFVLLQITLKFYGFILLIYKTWLSRIFESFLNLLLGCKFLKIETLKITAFSARTGSFKSNSLHLMSFKRCLWFFCSLILIKMVKQSRCLIFCFKNMSDWKFQDGGLARMMQKHFFKSI